jgi:hypothetical protein
MTKREPGERPLVTAKPTPHGRAIGSSLVLDGARARIEDKNEDDDESGNNTSR